MLLNEMQPSSGLSATLQSLTWVTWHSSGLCQLPFLQAIPSVVIGTSVCQFTIPGSLVLEGEVGRKEELNCVAVNSAMLFRDRAETVPIYSAK